MSDVGKVMEMVTQLRDSMGGTIDGDQKLTDEEGALVGEIVCAMIDLPTDKRTEALNALADFKKRRPRAS